MNKLLLIFLSITLFVLVSVTGTLFFAFSNSGNNVLKTYLHKELEEKIGLPVEVRKFTLEAGKSSLSMRINKEANIKVEVHYDLLAQTFKGIYHVKAKNFHYEKMILRDVDIKGHFKGVAEDIVVDGIGSALDAPLAYRFRLLEQVPQNIEANIKGMALSEVLELAGQPSLAKGKIDVEINMPDIGKEFANGYGHIVLDKALFNTEVIKKIYDLTVPNKSYVSGNIDLKLKGNDLNFLLHTQSNLFSLNIEDASVNLENKKVFAKYMMDVKEMAILTQNQLAGPLKVAGNVEVKNEKYYVKGSTNTLGGALLFDISETSNFHFENLELAKILYLTKQPHYAKGLLSGSANLDKEFKSGKYDVKIQKGQFGAKSIEEKFGYQIPSINSFSFNSTGEITQSILNANATLKSTLSDVKLTEVIYDIEKQKLNADYDVFLPNIGLLIPNNKAVKRGYMSAKGKVKLDKTLYIKGSAKGLGEKLDFTYDSKTATVNADDLFVEKLLSLSALPRYVKGKLTTSVNITNIKNLDGDFSFKSDKLVTQPNVMKRLIDKKLNMSIALESKGKLKSGIAYFNTKMKTSMGNLTLDNMVFNTKNSTFKSAYVLDIQALEKTYALTEKKLYGPMLLSGDISQDKALKVTGMTNSLGGKIEYNLIGDVLKSKITKVSLENILGMLGHKKLVKGDAYGTATYNMKNKVGVIDIDINSFQIKPSSTTNTVKMFIGKDPARIIYNSTKLHADIKGEVTRYSLIAKGAHSSIEVTNGKVDKVNNTHTAKFKFVYEKYEVTGTIGGTVENPRIVVDPSSIMQSKTGEKIQKKLDKALGGDMGKAVGGFLKGLKF
jgi:hypothetical protein